MATKKPAATPEPGGALTLEAIEPIRHDGVYVAPGATLTVSAEAAAALIAAGAAKASG